MSPADLTLASPPRITLARFVRILEDARSPAAAQAVECYRVIAALGVDPAVALAFFGHESSYGRSGIAARTRNWGNLRKGQGRATGTLGGFASYASWRDGAADWAQLIAVVYVRQRGLTTVRQAIPVYAPASDHNAPDAYIDAVLTDVARWQAQADPWVVWGDACPLPVEQRGYAIP